jgi:ATP-dependent DNA helicase UvrD/PcrA
MTTIVFTPTAEQQEAVDHPLDPLFLVAGAGAGKTTVIAERILALVTTGAARADEILALTFTNKAAANLKAKVMERLGPDADVTVSTYHGFGASLVAAHALELDLAPDTIVLNRAQAWQLLYAVFDEFRFQRRGTMAPQLLLDDALALASRCADHLVDVATVAADCEEKAAGGRWTPLREAAAKRLELCQVVRAYEQRKRERNLLDYGDQIALAVRLLEEHPDLAGGYRADRPVVLLDEYQDTNFAQRRMLQLLYGPGSAITAVGDDMQSIYAFRGAHLANVLRFEDHFPPVTTKALQVTFRFGRRLVELANRIQAQVSQARPKVLRPAAGVPDTTIECFLAADDADEAATIADDIAAGGPPWGRYAVLCRKRRLIPPIATALEERKLPVDVIGASGLLHRPEVVDVVAWLEVLVEPAASVALLRILEGPRYRIGRRDLAALARHDEERLAGALDELDAVDGLSDAARERLSAFAVERAALDRQAARLPVLDLIETILLRTGLWRAAGERGRENLLRLLDLAERFSPVEGDPGLPAFVEYLRLLDESEEDLAEAHPTDRDAVRLMTIHQAKGLEFPVVFVPGLSGSKGASRIFPDRRSGENAISNSSVLPWWLREDDDDFPDLGSVRRVGDIEDLVRTRKLDEEWRLFYVACTRAQERLVCSAAQWYPGPAEPQGPSLFYDFVAAQGDLVTERFRREPPAVDPEVAAKERNREAALRRYSRPDVSDTPPRLLDDDQLPPAVVARRAPTALSVTGLVTYARCPKQFYWSVVRPLPRQSSAAARLGTEVHRWIEQRSGRQLALLEPEVEPDLDPDAAPVGSGERAALQRSFLASPYADLEPVRVEAPFVIAAGQHLVRGRIDAVYERDGRLELVDFKTGHRPSEGDAGAGVQLDLYGLAAVDTWSADPDRLRTTYCWLQADGPAVLESVDWTGADLDTVRTQLATELDALAAGRYEPTPGAWCRSCDFLSFCPAGRRALAETARAT